MIQTGNTEDVISARNSEFKGWLQVILPAVEKRSTLTVMVALLSKAGVPIHESDIALDVFPIGDKSKTLTYLGGQAQRLIAN